MTENLGQFSGNPVLEWLPDGRDMLVRERFSYVDPDGRLWIAEPGRRVNGASIPRALWTLTGSPYTGLYRNASIIHDVYCEDARTPEERKAADVMFYHACRCGGVPRHEAVKLYLAVRFDGALEEYPAEQQAVALADIGISCAVDLDHSLA